MGIDVTHLVFEALGDTNDHVVDERAHGSETGDLFAYAMVELNLNDVLLGTSEADGEMAKVLNKLACRCIVLKSRTLAEFLLRAYFWCTNREVVVWCWINCIPRGPSTVMILVLMSTLTICPVCQQSLWQRL